MASQRYSRSSSRLPPDRGVVLKGYENGYADVSGLRERQIKLDVHPEWWNGPHEAAESATRRRCYRARQEREGFDKRYVAYDVSKS
jgi:hypothetical protein